MFGLFQVLWNLRLPQTQIIELEFDQACRRVLGFEYLVQALLNMVSKKVNFLKKDSF